MSYDALATLLGPEAQQLLRNDLPTPLYHQMFLLLHDRIVSGEIPCEKQPSMTLSREA